MKIGLTTTSFRTDQGAERFVVNLAKGLLQSDQEVHVIGRLEHKTTLEEFYDNLSTHQQTNFHFHRIRTIKAHRYPNLLTYAWGVHRVLKQLPLDVTQGFGKSLGIDVFRPPTATFKTLLAQTAGKVKSRLAANLELAIEKRILLQEAKVIVVNSEFGAKTLKSAYPALRTPIRVIYNMIDLEKWQINDQEQEKIKQRDQLGIPHNALVFLHVSTNFKLKGVPQALKALELLKKNLPPSLYRHIVLLLVGERRYKVPSHLKDQVLVFPRTNTVQPFYTVSDVLLHPSRFDPFANVVLEAFASGMPVITSKTNGAYEIITNGTDGTILENIEPPAIYKSLLVYLNPEHRQTMKAAALLKAQHFTIEAMTDQFIQLYETVSSHLPQKTRRVSLQPLRPLFSSSLN